MIAALAAMAGHIFPVWLDFKGGKGVATSLGVLFGLFWPLGLIFIVLWLALAYAFRMSSVAGLATSALTPLWAYLLGRPGSRAADSAYCHCHLDHAPRQHRQIDEGRRAQD